MSVFDPLPRRLARKHRKLRFLGAALACAISTCSVFAAAATNSPRYGVGFTLTPDPDTGTIRVRLVLEQDRPLLRELRFAGARVTDVEGDGRLTRDGEDYVWQPPATGGTLEWRANARHKRSSGGHDAWLDGDFGLLRMEDVIPRAATRHMKGSVGETRLRFRLPDGWSVVTEYKDEDGRMAVTSRDRSLTLPTGWMVMGELGVRRELIAGTRVAVAGPVGHDVRRMDIVAFLNWTLPQLARVLPEPPARITVVSADGPMWRGGLSAPQSLYLHADRPLLSENATSTLLHEVMHVAMGASAERGYDWIVEGFAEFYSLEILRRSGGITLPRYRAALADLAEWGESADALCDRSSTGPETALAVTVLERLDGEIRSATGGEHSLDDVLHAVLEADRKLSLDGLRDTVRDLIDTVPDSLKDRNLPGCADAG